MYESPVTIYETAMETIIEHRENAIFAKVQDAFDVQVDKAELLRALQYDRNQYEKGYADGKRDAMDELVRCKDCKYGIIDDADFPNQYLCKHNGCDWNGGEHFCSYGEKR